MTGTEWYALDWTLPCEVGNVVQGDSLEITITLYAEQKRHNDDPGNPWG